MHCFSTCNCGHSDIKCKNRDGSSNYDYSNKQKERIKKSHKKMIEEGERGYPCINFEE